MCFRTFSAVLLNSPIWTDEFLRVFAECWVIKNIQDRFWKQRGNFDYRPTSAGKFTIAALRKKCTADTFIRACVVLLAVRCVQRCTRWVLFMSDVLYTRRLITKQLICISNSIICMPSWCVCVCVCVCAWCSTAPLAHHSLTSRDFSLYYMYHKWDTKPRRAIRPPRSSLLFTYSYPNERSVTQRYVMRRSIPRRWCCLPAPWQYHAYSVCSVYWVCWVVWVGLDGCRLGKRVTTPAHGTVVLHGKPTPFVTGPILTSYGEDDRSTDQGWGVPCPHTGGLWGLAK